MEAGDAMKEKLMATEIEYKRICEELGKEKAFQYMVLLSALHEETATRFGKKNARPYKRDC